MNRKIFTYLTIILLLSSCQSIKDGLTGKKRENTDEFLVIKKNPLEIPPEFNDLPVPKAEKNEDQSEIVDQEIESLIKSIDSNKKIQSENRSAEELVIKEINKN